MGGSEKEMGLRGFLELGVGWGIGKGGLGVLGGGGFVKIFKVG